MSFTPSPRKTAPSFEVRAKEVPPHSKWAATSWRFIIISDSLHGYEGTYGAGSSHHYSGPEDPDLLDGIFWSVAQDLYSTDNGETIEEIVKDLVRDDLATIDEAFDIAASLRRLNIWYNQLDDDERKQLDTIVEGED